MSIRRSEPAYRQIADYYRQAILSGELECGAKLPSVQALSHQFETSIFTIQTAMTGLVDEGLLERRPRIGTIVRGVASRLASVGIYFDRNIWDNTEEGFYREVCAALQTQLTEQQVRTQIWFDTRSESERTTPFPPLQEAANRREIQAIIAPLVSLPDLQWLPKLTSATAFLTDANLYNQVNFDLSQMLRVSLTELQEQGCRSVGIISAVEVTDRPLSSPQGRSLSFYEEFLKVAKELGLETRTEWIRSPEDTAWNQEHYGYEEFLKLWDQEERPEGLLIYPDIAARGAMTAMLARNVSVPEELKVVMHVNDRNPYPCPIPVAQIISHVGAVAEALISIVRQQLAGQATHSVFLPFVLRHHHAPTVSPK